MRAIVRETLTKRKRQRKKDRQLKKRDRETEREGRQIERQTDREGGCRDREEGFRKTVVLMSTLLCFLTVK